MTYFIKFTSCKLHWLKAFSCCCPDCFIKHRRDTSTHHLHGKFKEAAMVTTHAISVLIIVLTVLATPLCLSYRGPTGPTRSIKALLHYALFHSRFRFFSCFHAHFWHQKHEWKRKKRCLYYTMRWVKTQACCVLLVFLLAFLLKNLTIT